VSAKYRHVFSPLRIGPVEVPNRIFFPGHGLPLVAGGPQGTRVPSEDCAHYYAERAAGGVGLLILTTLSGPGVRVSALHEESVPSFKAVADLVHKRGARLFAQIGDEVWARPGGTWEPLGPSRPLVGPSPDPRFETYDVRHGLATSAMPEFIARFGRCAQHLSAAGYDGIEIAAAHGHVIEQFISPYFNHRTDQYGGSTGNRLRTLIQILESVRSSVSSQMAVGVRFNCDERLVGGFDQDNAKQMLTTLINMKLIDFANLDIGVVPQQAGLIMPPHFVEALHQTAFVERVGEVTRSKIVTMTAPGRLTTVAQAEQLIRAHVADMVGSARGLIAEPEMVKNAAEGRENRNRICIACNACLAASRSSWYCAINPATGREGRWGVAIRDAVLKGSKVVVVGGGPAGLEAARVASMRGAHTVLLERENELGGQLRLWARLPEHEHMLETPQWYGARLAELGVDIRTTTEATTELVLAEQPDAVIVATGGRYSPEGISGFLPLPIPGWDKDIVYTPEAMFRGNKPTGRVLVLDEEGLHTGAGIAALLAQEGCQVELVTSQSQIVSNLVATLESTHIIGRLKRLGVVVTTESYIKVISDHEVVVYDIFTNVEQRRLIDAVVLATRRQPQELLCQQLEGKVLQVYAVGDALAPRGLSEATFEGQRFARLVGDRGAPRTSDEALMRPPDPASSPRPAAALYAV
jgi:2,4-dienoyl-CoA reductase-like NADH-dependent reductase (Old Yellow Enzyme family)/thioredoxin reductase